MKITNICLLVCHNLYESKQYFTAKLAEALNRHGVKTSILTWSHGKVPEEIVKQIEALVPDLTASFHQLPSQKGGAYFWDQLKIPHWTILVDPVFYDLELMQSPFSILSCVDRFDCDLLRSYHFEKGFFFPHAVERELIVSPDLNERDIDVIFLGTCYDPETLASYFKKTYSKKIFHVLMEATSLVLGDNKTTFLRALLQALTFEGVDPKEVFFDQLAYEVDSYARGVDRLNLIRSIKTASVHVYGGKCWREIQPIQDWSYYLGKQKNVHVHPPVNFADGLKLLQRSKICLNSAPFFKNGSHERVFASLACGAMPLTSDNLYLREQFTQGEDLLFYQTDTLSQVDSWVNTVLNDEKGRREVVKNGQQKIQEHHTWDARVKLLKTFMTPYSF
jgi:spore maturation protein CgeB